MWNWIKEKLLGPVIAAAIIAVLAFVVGLTALPGRVELLEKQTDKIPEIFRTVGHLESDQKNFKEASDTALANVKDFSTKLLTLGQSSGELKGHIENLKGLTTDIRELRKAIDDLRSPAQEKSLEISALVFLTEQNLKKEGDLFVAQLQYPERLLGGRPVRDVRARLSTISPVSGLSSITAFADAQKTGYNLLLTVPAQEADIVTQFLKKQPIRVEVIYVVDR